MSDAIHRAERAYYEARKICYKVMKDTSLSMDKRRAASQRRKNAYAAYAEVVLHDFFSRTTMLSKLVAELNGLADDIRGGNSATAMDTVTAGIKAISTALEEDEKDNS